MVIASTNPVDFRGTSGGRFNLDTDAASRILKEHYEGPVRDLVVSHTTGWRMFQGNTQRIESDGKYAVIPLRTGRNHGHAYSAEGGLLADPGSQTWQRAKYDIRSHYGRIYLTGQRILGASGGQASFVSGLSAEMSGLGVDMARDNNRMLYGNGRGALAMVNNLAGYGAGAGVVVAVDNPGGFTNPGPGTQYFEVGMRVLFVTTGGAYDGSGTITAVNPSANTITIGTLDAAIGDNSWIVRQTDTTTPSAGLGSYAEEPYGLRALVADDNPGLPAPYANVGNIDRTTEPAWNSIVVDNNGVIFPFYSMFLQQLVYAIATQGGGKPGAFLTTYGIQLQYMAEMQGSLTHLKRTNNDNGMSDENLSFNGIPIVPDRDCTRGYVYALDMESLYRYVLADYHWISAGGAVLRQVVNRDAYEATLCAYQALVTDAPNRNGVGRNILDS